MAERRQLAAILVLAFALRTGLAVFYPGIAHPDEIFQYQEPAHRLLTGMGIVSWEWTRHIRSWLAPGLLLPLMAGVRMISHNATVYWNFVSAALALLSLPLVAVAWSWGREQGGQRGGLIAGFVAAASFQLVYFSTHLLMDTLATDILVPALYAARRYHHDGGVKPLAAAGILLALLVYLRPQMLPAALVPAVALLIASIARHQIFPCLAWGFGTIAVLAGFDWITLGQPLQSVWLYVHVNLYEVNTAFGVKPWYSYLKLIVTLWMIGVIPVAWFNVVAFKRFRIEIITALVMIGSLSLIGHKEPRFILPALAVLLITMGVGIGEFIRGRSGFWSRPAPILAIYALSSAGLSLAHTFLPVIQRSHTELLVMRRIQRDPLACGIDLIPADSMLSYAGYTGLRDGIRLYDNKIADPRSAARGANYLITRLRPPESAKVPAGYQLQFCKGTTGKYEVCVYHRAGGCA